MFHWRKGLARGPLSRPLLTQLIRVLIDPESLRKRVTDKVNSEDWSRRLVNLAGATGQCTVVQLCTTLRWLVLCHTAVSSTSMLSKYIRHRVYELLKGYDS